MTKRVLGLRTVNEKRQSYQGFQWPSSGKVVAPDWDDTPECGHGLHALIGGIGEGTLLNWDAAAIWQAVWIPADKIVDLEDKAKFPWCRIACEGTREEVIRFMVKHGADATKMVGGIVDDDILAVVNGFGGRATANSYKGKATANGEKGKATANGKTGLATANGDNGLATANGAHGRACAPGSYGVAVANGPNGWAEANGDHGRATATAGFGVALANGKYGIAVATGYEGDAQANGDYGKAVCTGIHGVAKANGHCGQAYSYFAASAGTEGSIIITRAKAGKYHVYVGCIGVNGIEPGVVYVVAEDGRFVTF